jgi:hypothetical protein
MNNNIQIKANSKDIVAYGLLTHAFGLVLSLCTLIAFATLFPKFVGNQSSYATRMREFNVAVGQCLTKQVEIYGRRDVRACRAAVNAQLNFYEHR